MASFVIFQVLSNLETFRIPISKKPVQFSFMSENVILLKLKKHNFHYFELAQYILNKTAILTEKSVGTSKSSIFTSVILFLFNRLCEMVLLSKIWRLKDFFLEVCKGGWRRTEWHYVTLSEVCRTLKSPDSAFRVFWTPLNSS